METKKRSELAKPFVLESWRGFPPMNTSKGTMLHNLTGNWRYLKPLYEDKTPPCQDACPAGNDIEGWIRLLQDGEYERAYRHLKREQPFPSLLGRVCFTFCEKACNRQYLDESVSIRELERFVGDQGLKEMSPPDLPQPNGKNLAVVGSGPAGMSAAYFARLLGFEVTLFEALPVLGGILRVGIPAYRLPRNVLETEFQGLKNMGIDLRPGTRIGKDIGVKELGETFDYVFLASGVHQSLKLALSGEEECREIMSALSFLKKVALGEPPPIGKNTVVVGGGNTAIDAARTALRLGSKVTILYRRSRAEMPAHPSEIQEAEEEGVSFRFLAAPEKILLNDQGTLTGLLCTEMVLGPPDESGRRRPEKKEGALFEIPADTLLTAVGEKADLHYLEGMPSAEGRILTVGEDLRLRGPAPLERAKWFAGGDIIDIPHTVIHAVGSGKRAAIAMDCDRKGIDFSTVRDEITIGSGPALSFSAYMGLAPIRPVRRNLREVVDSSKMIFDYFGKAPRKAEEILEPSARRTSFAPYRETFTGDEARREGDRCLHCGRCTECDNCLVFCPDMSVLPRGRDEFGYLFDYDYCKGCGICYTECPRHAITMVEEETPVPEVKN
ncbi:MAG: FAD-dependent oxidoreductase [Deltaproteobacteria bacterium]|nr:FAD-dependent oxidoreductase [Deltaproteobacteria bacterium]